MSYVLSGIGLLAFVAVSGFHFLSLWRVAGYYLPALALVFTVFLILVWLGGIALILYAIRRNKLKACLAVVFLYVMTITLTGHASSMVSRLRSARANGTIRIIV